MLVGKAGRRPVPITVQFIRENQNRAKAVSDDQRDQDHQARDERGERRRRVNGAFARNFVAGFRRLPDSPAAAVPSGLDEDTPRLPLEIECVQATGDLLRHER